MRSVLHCVHALLGALLLLAGAAGALGQEQAAAEEVYLCPDAAFSLRAAQRARGPAAVAPAAPGASKPAVDLRQDIEVSSEDATLSADGKARVQGKVQVQQGDRHLSADKVEVDSERNSIQVEGNVEYRDPQMTVSGTAGHYKEGSAEFRGAQFQLPQQPARGSARALAFDREGVIRLDDVTYTTCPKGNSDWQIRARSIRLDTNDQSGVGRGARVDFKGVPIIYLPWISFPLGTARQSGFLFPSIGNSSRSGLQLALPYYWNIAPNYDLNLQPTVYSRRGVDYAARFRYLTHNSRGFLDGNFLPGDRVRNADRNRLKLGSTTALPGNWRLAFDAENVSDVGYFEDFSQGTEGTSIAFLRRLAQLSYRDDRWQAGVQVRNFQTLDEVLAPRERPYTELPRVYADGWWSTGEHSSTALAFDYGFDSEVVNFQRSLGASGWRLDAQPRAVARLEEPGYFLRPSVGVRHTQYELDDAPPGIERSATRTLPVASVDAGLLFERPSGSQGKRRVTLEPRLLYLYVPYRNQDRLPVFDSGVPDLNLVQLFRTNRYLGADRVGDANQLSVGITTRLFASDNGARFLSATLGQTLYFQSPRVALPDEVLRDRQSSDLIAQLELRAFKNWSVDFGLQWDHELSRAEKSEVRLQYRPAGTQVVNVGYRFQRDRLEQAEVSAAWPIAKSWNAYGKVVYSLRERESIEHFAGVEYSSCCWGLRAVARHYVSARTGERDTGIYLQLELKGLSNVGIAADAFLERTIRGYSPHGFN